MAPRCSKSFRETAPTAGWAVRPSWALPVGPRQVPLRPWAVPLAEAAWVAPPSTRTALPETRAGNRSSVVVNHGGETRWFTKCVDMKVGLLVVTLDSESQRAAVKLQTVSLGREIFPLAFRGHVLKGMTVLVTIAYHVMASGNKHPAPFNGGLPGTSPRPGAWHPVTCPPSS